jgi:hypothetical protein
MATLYRNARISTYNGRPLISGETLEDYFKRLNLDDTRRKFLENIKQGKHEENAIDEHDLYVNRKEYSPITRDWYSIYMKRFAIRHRQRRVVSVIRKRTIYIDSELDKAIADAAIEKETRYSVCAEEALRSYLKTRKEKEKEKEKKEIMNTGTRSPRLLA